MKTREDVVTTIRMLLTDLKANPDAWENPTLERYLDAMAGWKVRARNMANLLRGNSSSNCLRQQKFTSEILWLCCKASNRRLSLSVMRSDMEQERDSNGKARSNS